VIGDLQVSRQDPRILDASVSYLPLWRPGARPWLFPCELSEEPLRQNLADHLGRGQLRADSSRFVGQGVRQRRHGDQLDVVRVRVLLA
jgi:hypothetical protein